MTTPKERQLDLPDSAAFMLTDATIVAAFRRRADPKDLLIGGFTDRGDAFIIQVTATIVVDGDGDRVARLVCIPVCDAKELKRLSYQLKEDVDAAEAEQPHSEPRRKRT